MVYESDFSRRQFLNSCAESGQFYSSPDYKPTGYLSTLRPPTTASSLPSPIGSRSERTAKLLASLSSNTQPQSLRYGAQSQYRQPLDPEHPYTSSETPEASYNGAESYIDRNVPYLPQNGPNHQRGCCACCHNCGNGGRSTGRISGFVPPEPSSPFGASNLRSQHGMESYIRSRRPHFEDSEILQIKAKAPYSVRNIPVRSLEELRETVAIRRNYIKERQQLLNDASASQLALPALTSRENSASPQPDGSIVTYPSDDASERNGRDTINSMAGSYHEVE